VLTEKNSSSAYPNHIYTRGRREANRSRSFAKHLERDRQHNIWQSAQTVRQCEILHNIFFIYVGYLELIE